MTDDHGVSMETLRLVVVLSPTPMLVADDAGTIVLVNRELERL